MRNLLKVLTVFIVLVPALLAQDKPSADVRFSADMLDKNIDPCNDFHACSKWQAPTRIPPTDRPGDASTNCSSGAISL